MKSKEFNKPFFSIIIPTLNEETYLPRLLTSISQQNFSSFEVVLVDAVSTDRTKQVVQSFKSRIPLILVTVKKRQVGYQRNHGADHACGTFLLFCDADTQLPTFFLNDLKIKLQKKKVDFAVTYGVPDTGILIHRVVAYGLQTVLKFMNYVGKPLMSSQNLLFRKEAFDLMGGFDETIVLAEDFELISRAVQRGLCGDYFFHPFHIMSLRRLTREGYISVLVKCGKSFWYTTIHGPIRKQIYEYRMGGGAS